MAPSKKRIVYSIKDAETGKFVVALAAYLKKTGKVSVPDWVDVVKLSRGNELCPSDPDWYYIRCASLLRRLYNTNHIGVGNFAKVYGVKQRNGTRPAHHVHASTAVIRKALQSMEALGYVEKNEHGRSLHAQGRRLLDRISYQVITGKSSN